MGGPAKSQLVHEVDALGGEMGKMADRCYVQKRVLNRSKVTYHITYLLLGPSFEAINVAKGLECPYHDEGPEQRALPLS